MSKVLTFYGRCVSEDPKLKGRIGVTRRLEEGHTICQIVFDNAPEFKGTPVTVASHEVHEVHGAVKHVDDNGFIRTSAPMMADYPIVKAVAQFKWEQGQWVEI